MKSLVNQITECIETTFDIGGHDYSKNIVVFPYGDIGIQMVEIMRNVYGIEPELIIDNHKSKYSDKIKPSSYLEGMDLSKKVLLLASTNVDIYLNLRKNVLNYFDSDRIIELEIMKKRMKENPMSLFHTKVGRYSYGPICKNHDLIESIGSFCSFAVGVEVVANHEMNCITTHPMVYVGQEHEGIEIDYNYYNGTQWFIAGVKPKPPEIKKKRISIGNDVWLGQNVLITNYSNIGNGVIAGAGAVITKDVPDYAVVTGVPARIIKYRYSKDQIEKLNTIRWWDWSDEEIRERFDDFYLPVDDFIRKYY